MSRRDTPPAIMTRDDSAPGHRPTADGLPWWRRALLQGAGYFLPNTLFLAIPVMLAVTRLDPVPAALVVVEVVAVAVLFLGATVVMHWTLPRRWLWVGALLAVAAVPALLFADPGTPVYYSPYVTACAAVLLPWRSSRLLVVGIALAGVVVGVAQRDVLVIAMAVTGAALGLSIGLSLAHEATREALTREQERTAALAAVAERERIGRDLHDILGHSLTTIAVRADLAARLVDRDPGTAKVEIAGLAQVARQALADVRATASGMTQVRVAAEVASARSVLGAAGIACQAPSALPPYDDETAELFGYVVREAVTNVVRHSGAATCTIEADDRSVTVTDDGRGIRDEPRTGLAGLADRLARAGGHLQIGSPGRGTTVRAVLEAPA